MKKFIGMLLSFAAACLVVGCATKDTVKETAKSEDVKTEVKTDAKEVTSNHPFGISDERYEELMQSALISTGNTARIKKFVEKLKNGEDVYMAAIGGSVTEGAGPASYKDGYAYQFNKKIREKYCSDGGKNVYFDGAGLSGTPSELGLVRYESDVVDVLKHNPDLLIIEFAVNDNGMEPSTRAFEAMIRKALEANNDCVVIALYSAATYGNSAAAKKPVAEFYEIPQIDVLSLVKKAVAAGDFAQNKYYTDIVHPTKEGHEIQADCLMYMIEKSLESEDDIIVMVPDEWCRPKPFTNFTRIKGDDENVKITAGGFNGTDNATQGIKKTNKPDFPQNWYYNGTTKESFKMTINCKALILTYKENGNWTNTKFGKAEVYVDGVKKETLDGQPNGGWGNCVPKLIIDYETCGEHTVEVKMAAGDEDKAFTIVAMGYSY